MKSSKGDFVQGMAAIAFLLALKIPAVRAAINHATLALAQFRNGW
jgi:hypothetical protein